MAGADLTFHPDAREEADAALLWYARQSPAAASAFLEELDRAVRAVRESPERWAERGHGIRKFPLRRFPYLLIYRLRNGSVEIVAVAHAKRKPGYWKKR